MNAWGWGREWVKTKQTSLSRLITHGWLIVLAHLQEYHKGMTKKI